MDTVEGTRSPAELLATLTIAPVAGATLNKLTVHVVLSPRSSVVAAHVNFVNDVSAVTLNCTLRVTAPARALMIEAPVLVVEAVAVNCADSAPAGTRTNAVT
jgi:hypothetical protein